MDFKFGALLIISAQICATLARSPCICTRNFSPVCGSDGKTYSNHCTLECAAYKSGTEITEVHTGPCKDETQPEPSECVCTLEYRPVCGTDGQTYPNKCALNCQKSRYNPSLEVAHTGSCDTPKEPACVCQAIYKPVCGSDGKTYANDCSLNCATKDNSQLSISHRGVC